MQMLSMVAAAVLLYVVFSPGRESFTDDPALIARIQSLQDAIAKLSSLSGPVGDSARRPIQQELNAAIKQRDDARAAASKSSVPPPPATTAKPSVPPPATTAKPSVPPPPATTAKPSVPPPATTAKPSVPPTTTPVAVDGGPPVPPVIAVITFIFDWIIWFLNLFNFSSSPKPVAPGATPLPKEKYENYPFHSSSYDQVNSARFAPF